MPPWLLSAVYGPTNNSDKNSFWESIYVETLRFLGAWMLIGDLMVYGQKGNVPAIVALIEDLE